VLYFDVYFRAQDSSRIDKLPNWPSGASMLLLQSRPQAHYAWSLQLNEVLK